MNIYLTRHGETRLNKDELMQGHVDEPLSEVGIAQAKARREMLGDISIPACVEARKSFGGTSPTEVERQIRTGREWLESVK